MAAIEPPGATTHHAVMEASGIAASARIGHVPTEVAPVEPVDASVRAAPIVAQTVAVPIAAAADHGNATGLVPVVTDHASAPIGLGSVRIGHARIVAAARKAAPVRGIANGLVRHAMATAIVRVRPMAIDPIAAVTGRSVAAIVRSGVATGIVRVLRMAIDLIAAVTGRSVAAIVRSGVASGIVRVPRMETAPTVAATVHVPPMGIVPTVVGIVHVPRMGIVRSVVATGIVRVPPTAIAQTVAEIVRSVVATAIVRVRPMAIDPIAAVTGRSAAGIVRSGVATGIVRVRPMGIVLTVVGIVRVRRMGIVRSVVAMGIVRVRRMGIVLTVVAIVRVPHTEIVLRAAASVNAPKGIDHVASKADATATIVADVAGSIAPAANVLAAIDHVRTEAATIDHDLITAKLRSMHRCPARSSKKHRSSTTSRTTAASAPRVSTP